MCFIFVVVVLSAIGNLIVCFFLIVLKICIDEKINYLLYIGMEGLELDKLD